MSNLTIEEKFKQVISTTASDAKNYGYRRRGLHLTRTLNGNIAIIAFQKSRDNTADFCKFTVNLSIVCGLLWDEEVRPIEKANEYDGHLRQRIGYLMQPANDLWWVIQNTTSADEISDEVRSVVVNAGMPYLEKYIDNSALFDLWSSGQSPGQTEFSRRKFLKELQSKY
jgi:hypothetical protein